MDKDLNNKLTYTVRGGVSNESGERGLAQLLLDIEHYVHITAK